MSDDKVEIPTSHYNEWESQREFEALIKPWYMPFGWSSKDYGLDGQVEITRPIKDSDSFEPDSKFFFIQMKGTTKLIVSKNQISYTVQVRKIVQWYRANLPVMFVLYDTDSKKFYYLWINENLINNLDSINPNWVNQKTISIKISTDNIINSESLSKIREYVLEWKVPSKKIIQPGVYFELKDKCSALLNKYKELSEPFGFNSMKQSLGIFNTQIEQSIYKIAITGPARVGKSSLINTLLRRRDVSPTGFFQTTGVPIQVLPGKKDSVKITFLKGSSLVSDFSPKVIEEHASQDHNEDNVKGVALVAISIANRQLERGVSLFDIPGLNDPNENIYNYAWNTATKANAIIYVIDASSAEHGGFIFSSDYKKHITELGQSLDKIFLVFNKINVLTGNNLERLQERITHDLKKHNLYDKIGERVYYVSAQESMSVRMKESKEGKDTVQKLEDDIWSYLLKENKTGIINLTNITKEVYKSTNDFEGLLKTRLLNNETRIKLENAVDAVKNKIPELKKIYDAREKEIKKSIARSVENRKNSILTNLEEYLKSIPVGEELPDKKVVRNYLTQAAHQTLEKTNKEYLQHINQLKGLIDDWVEVNLKDVRNIINGNAENKLIDFSDLENIETPSLDLSSAFGIGIVAGLVTLLVTPGAALAAAFAAFFGNLIFSAEDRRARRISKLMTDSRKRYNILHETMIAAYNDLIKEHSTLVRKYADEKIKFFFNDIHVQLGKLDQRISPEEEKSYNQAFERIAALRKDISNMADELKQWNDAT